LPHAPVAPVTTLAALDTGHGSLLIASTSITVLSISAWDGTSWSTFDAGLPQENRVESLAVCDIGTGPALYASVASVTASGPFVSRLARWSGTSWQLLPGAANSSGYCLAAFDDGTGSAIYLGGHFGEVGGIPASFIARWNGSGWYAVGAAPQC